MCLLVLAWKATHGTGWSSPRTATSSMTGRRTLAWWQTTGASSRARPARLGTWMGAARSGRSGSSRTPRSRTAAGTRRALARRPGHPLPDRRDLAEGIPGRPARPRARYAGFTCWWVARALYTFSNRDGLETRPLRACVRPQQSLAGLAWPKLLRTRRAWRNSSRPGPSNRILFALLADAHTRR